MNKKYKCKKCGHELKKDEIPCPKCGCKSRAISIEIIEKIEIHDKIEGKAKHKNCKKPFNEFISGDDLYRKSGKWYHKERNIDRENNKYREIIKDKKTGKVIHRCEEPLSKHTGHGSDKKKTTK